MSLRRKIGLALLGLLLLLPSAALYYVAATESGLQFVTRRLGKVGPVTLTMEGVSGTLARGFTVRSLRVQHRLSDVRVEDIRGRVDLLPLLLLQRINVAEGVIGHASVQLIRDPVQRPPRAPRFLPRLLRIDADAVSVARAEVILISGRELAFTNARGAVTILPNQIRIRGAALDWDKMHFVASGRVHARAPIGLEGDVDLEYRPDGLPAWFFAGRFDGDLDRLPLDITIDKPFHATVTGAATTLNKSWRYAGDAAVKDFDLEPFGGGRALGIISGELAVAVAADGFTANGTLTPPGLKAGPLQVAFDGSYANKRVSIRSARATHAPSGSRASVRGSVEIVPGGPRLALSGDWATLRWPLGAEQPAFHSARGSYTLSGLRPWLVTAEGPVDAAGYSGMPATLKGHLAGDALAIDEATVQLLGGNARVQGEARWQPAESWRVKGTMSGLDPSQLRADLPGRLQFDLDASGTPFGATGTIEFALSKLRGQLRGQAASGHGHFTLPPGGADWLFKGVDLRFGRTRLQLDGSFGADRDLTFALDADDLSLLDPDAKGRITARGRYAARAAGPALLFKARGGDFEWQGNRLASLDADIDLDLGSNGHARGQAELTGIGIGARTAQSATLTLTGDAEAQRVAIDVEAAPLRAALAATGTWRDGLWQGSVQSLRATDARDLTLQLERPAIVRLNLEQMELEQLCLKGGEERLCAAGLRHADRSWNASFSADALPLRLLTAGLTQDIDYEGTIKVSGELAGSPGALPIGAIRGELNQAQLRHRLGNGRDERLSLGSGRVNASATPDAFTMDVSLDAGASGNFRGRLDGERNTGDWHDYPIKGTLDATTDGLALLDIYVGGIDKATGRVTTRVEVGGTLGAPTINGLLQLRDAAIDVYQVNLSLRELSLDARFDTEALEFNGQSRLGEGQARFNGRLAWRDREPFGNLHVEGERLLVVNVPEARIETSPKLDFKLAGRRIDATGEVRVPLARLEPADLTNAVLASSDERLVGTPEPDPAQRWTVVSDIRLVLGENVQINSLGLTARLGGGITVRTDETQVSRGQGELLIESGKYAALGRLLDIDRGRLIFNNVPIGDPGVDLRAQKVFPDVTAGVNVRGSLRAPRMTFYSKPSIPQSQIVSLILAGGSLESVQNSQRPGAARNDLLAQGGAILAQRVGSRVGVDDVGIEQDLTNDTSLVLGKYLSPRLYVSYGISLAEAINTLKLRYTIGDRWTIKTEAGKARSADLVYTFQKNRKVKR